MLKNTTDRTALLYLIYTVAMHLLMISLTCVYLGRPVLFTEKTVFNMKKDTFLLNLQEQAMFSRNAYSRNEYCRYLCYAIRWGC